MKFLSGLLKAFRTAEVQKCSRKFSHGLIFSRLNVDTPKNWVHQIWASVYLTQFSEPTKARKLSYADSLLTYSRYL